MDPIVKCFLFLHLFNIGIHLSARTTNAIPAFPADDGECKLKNSTVMSMFTFKRPEHCIGFQLVHVTFTETSQQLFDSIAGGMDSMFVFECNLDFFYLPSSLTILRITGYSGCTTQIVIAENTTYKLEHIELRSLPQLPANLGVLRSLRLFHCYKLLETNVDLIILDGMMQLARIDMAHVAGVTGTESLLLPSLRELRIVHSPTAFVNGTSFDFPALEWLYLQNNSLQAIPDHCSTFINLTRFSITNNKLQRVVFDVFARMKLLVILELSENEITEIVTEQRIELPRLRNLYLNHNKLTELNVILWVMPALQMLMLGGNQLKQLAGLQALITANLRTIVTSGNPWDCAWTTEMVKEVSNLQISAADSEDFCHTTAWNFEPLG